MESVARSVMQPKYGAARSCSKCDHLIKVQMHKVFLNNLWIWLYLGIIKAKLAAEGQSRSQGRGFSSYPGTVAQPRRGGGTVRAKPSSDWNKLGGNPK